MTLGRILLLLGLLSGLWSLVQLVVLARYRGPAHGRGTPGYARARDARRFAAWGLAGAILLLVLGAAATMGSWA